MHSVQVETVERPDRNQDAGSCCGAAHEPSLAQGIGREDVHVSGAVAAGVWGTDASLQCSEIAPVCNESLQRQ
jgi:hypothetical protein